MLSKTPRFYPYTQEIPAFTFTKENQDPDKPAQRLVIHFTQDQCRIVRIGYNSQVKLIADAALKDTMMRVVELNLQSHNIGDKGCKLVSSVSLPKLKVLNLGSNKITGKGVFHLSKLPAKLSLIYLTNNKIGKQGLYWLTKLQTSLRLLNLQTNSLKNTDLTPLLLAQSSRMGQLIFHLPPPTSDQFAMAKTTLDHLKNKYAFAQFYY